MSSFDNFCLKTQKFLPNHHTIVQILVLKNHKIADILPIISVSENDTKRWLKCTNCLVHLFEEAISEEGGIFTKYYILFVPAIFAEVQKFL